MTQLRLYVDGVEAEISPSDVTWQMKLGAVTTFGFPYPNDGGRARGVFHEQKTLVTITIPGMSTPLLVGFVSAVSDEPVARVECADPMYFLSNKSIYPEELDEYVGYDIGRVAAELVLNTEVGESGAVTERVVGTNPFIPLPQGFIDEATQLDDLLSQMIDYVKEETIRLLPDENVTYFAGFTGGTFRFERLPDVDEEDTHFTLYRDRNLFEEQPDFHFDRLVNRARAYGLSDDADTVVGELFEDLHSITVFGIKEPESHIEIESTDPLELYLRARHEVMSKKDLQVTRNIDLPHAPWVTPGLYNVDVVRSAYGADGKSRIIQVQGGIGPSGRIRLQLSAIPLDEGEVLRKVVLGSG